MQLGTAELDLGLAGVFRWFGGGSLRIVDTVTERDADLTRDFFTPTAKPESKGICVFIKQL